MFDIIPLPAQPRGFNQTLPSTKAQLFVNGEHTAADERTRQIILLLLEEIGVLQDAPPWPKDNGEAPKVNKRTAEKVEKYIGFMASFLRVVGQVDRFGILMDRHRWTGTPCGYTAARTVTKALLDQGYIRKTVSPRKGQSTVYRCSEAFEDRVRRQGFSDFAGRFVTEALVRFLFKFRQQRLGAASGVFGSSAF